MKLAQLLSIVVVPALLMECTTISNSLAHHRPESTTLKPSQIAQPTSCPTTDYTNVDLVALQEARGPARGSGSSSRRPARGSS